MNRHEADPDPEGLSLPPRGRSINNALRESEPGFLTPLCGLKSRGHVVVGAQESYS